MTNRRVLSDEKTLWRHGPGEVVRAGWGVPSAHNGGKRPPGGTGVRRCSGPPGEPWGWWKEGPGGAVSCRAEWPSPPQRPGGEVQAILTWTSVPSSRPCPVPASPRGTVWKPEEAVRGERWRWGGCGDREAGGEGRREDLAEEGLQPKGLLGFHICTSASSWHFVYAIWDRHRLYI